MEAIPSTEFDETLMTGPDPLEEPEKHAILTPLGVHSGRMGFEIGLPPIHPRVIFGALFDCILVMH
jgi:hypothetical protein